MPPFTPSATQEKCQHGVKERVKCIDAIWWVSSKRLFVSLPLPRSCVNFLLHTGGVLSSLAMTAPRRQSCAFGGVWKCKSEFPFPPLCAESEPRSAAAGGALLLAAAPVPGL